MAASMVITFLPNEIIEHILENDELDVKDVTKFAFTCKHFYKIIMGSNKLWRTKFFQRYPTLKEAYEEHLTQGLKITDWLRETRLSVEEELKLMNMLPKMSSKHYRKEELSHTDFQQFDCLFRPERGAHPMAYHFVTSKLIDIVKTNPNLTVQYYALKVLRYIRQCYLTDEWHKFLALPPKQQLLEKGATLVAQWSQPDKNVPYWYIRCLLDDIAKQTKALLKTRHSSHTIFTVPAEQFEQWRCNEIDDNQWGNVESRQILDAISEMLFVRLGFHGNSDMFYSSENSFIDCVMESRQGIAIIIAIIFESVARRLGIKCEPVSFPAHFLLRWKERYRHPESSKVEHFYIDLFNGGDFVTKNSCPRVADIPKCPIESNNKHNAASAVQVVDRIATNLEVAARQHQNINGRAARLRSALELRHMIRPKDTNIILQLGRFYMLHQVDLSSLVGDLKNLQKDLEPTSRGQADHILQMLQVHQKHTRPEEIVTVKRRVPNVMYAVGMVMRYRNESLCVITGWDLCREVPTPGVGERNEESNEIQPFYSIFVDGGSSLYVDQSHLFPATPVVTVDNSVDHCDIGRYFCRFNGNYYLPNEEKEKEYPQDREIREKWIT